MNRYGNAEMPDRAFADKLATALGERHVQEIEQARMQNRGPASKPAGDDDKILRDCGLCGRTALRGSHAWWAHVRDRHGAEVTRMVEQRSRFTPESERFEEALIRISNAYTLDEACSIALSALSDGP